MSLGLIVFYVKTRERCLASTWQRGRAKVRKKAGMEQ